MTAPSDPTPAESASRVPLINSAEGADPAARAAFARIEASRGGMLRPFEVLLHAPDAAERVAELGAVVRSGTSLADADRELVTLATGRAAGCAFVWDSHLGSARAAGVGAAAIEALDRGDDLPGREGQLARFARELCRDRRCTDETFRAVHDLVGARGTVELALVVGYYVMLGTVMGAVEAC